MVFDLALTEANLLIEFDGPSHDCSMQRQLDAERDVIANEAGYRVVRRKVRPSWVIDPVTIEDLLSSMF